MPTSASPENPSGKKPMTARQSKIAALKGVVASNGVSCKGEIRVIEDGSLQWKDGDRWGRSLIFHSMLLVFSQISNIM